MKFEVKSIIQNSYVLLPLFLLIFYLPKYNEYSPILTRRMLTLPRALLYTKYNELVFLRVLLIYMYVSYHPQLYLQTGIPYYTTSMYVSFLVLRLLREYIYFLPSFFSLHHIFFFSIQLLLML